MSSTSSDGRSFATTLAEAVNQTLHDQAVYNVVKFLSEQIENIRKTDPKQNRVNFDFKELEKLDMFGNGQEQKNKIAKSVARELAKRGMRTTINPDSLEIQWQTKL